MLVLKRVNLFSIVLICSLIIFSESRAASVQLAVFETKDCDYCEMFYRDVADDYSKSWPGRIAPLHRINVNEYKKGKFDLKAPISIVPTFVLIENGKELLRLSGYFGRQNFFQIMTSVLEGYR